MDEFEPLPTGNVIPLETKLKDGMRDTALCVEAGSKNDPRMKEALTLMQSFLAIDDPVARTALVRLAEQLVSHDWARRAMDR